MKCAGFEPDSYAFYVLGTAPAEESTLIDNHLALKCERCLAEIAVFERVWGDVALTAPPARPPAGLRERILNEISPKPRVVKKKPEKRWSGLLVPALGFAFAVFVLSLAAIPWMASRKVLPNIVYSPRIVMTEPNSPVASTPRPAAPPSLAGDAQLLALRAELAAEKQRSSELEARLQMPVPQQAVSQQPSAPPPAVTLPQPPPVRVVENAAELQRLRDRVTVLEHQMTQYQTLLEIERHRADRSTEIAGFITSPQLRIVPLKGTERTPGAEGHVLISGNSQMVFAASGMPAPPANRTYQLWIIRSDQPAIASAGTFSPDREKRAVLSLSSTALLRNVTAFAVTDEPVGGSAQPTGQKWLIGL